MALNHAPSWLSQAECRDIETDLFFSIPPDDVARAVAICNQCAVRSDCFSYALEHADIHGIWGGTTEVERSLLRRAARR
jgi:WhiB family redox-sensing transcriptional regulator